MAGILLSGPAGGGKSQLSRDLIREATEPTVQADFQSIVVALLGARSQAGWHVSRSTYLGVTPCGVRPASGHYRR